MSSINLGNLPIEEVREIAAKGGHASHRRHDTDTVKDTTHSSTHTSTASTNPGNFANRPKEEVREIASKGGKASSGGFANMDPEKQVREHPIPLLNIMRVCYNKKINMCVML